MLSLVQMNLATLWGYHMIWIDLMRFDMIWYGLLYIKGNQYHPIGDSPFLSLGELHRSVQPNESAISLLKP